LKLPAPLKPALGVNRIVVAPVATAVPPTAAEGVTAVTAPTMKGARSTTMGVLNAVVTLVPVVMGAAVALIVTVAVLDASAVPVGPATL
jgi:hypothetical protein